MSTEVPHGTFLSSYVFNLVCKKGTQCGSENHKVKLLDHEYDKFAWFQSECSERPSEHNHLLNFDTISLDLPDDENAADYYETCVEVLEPLFICAMEYLKKIVPTQFCSDFKDLICWTWSEETVCEAFSVLQESDKGCGELAGLVITACLERGLGSLFLLKGTHCPNMLKDLLASTELTEVLGSQCVKLLRVIVGPPSSLNLRNILWHGFCLPDEVNRQYWYFLLLMIVSIGNLLKKKGIVDIPCRPYISLNKMDDMIDTFSGPSYEDNDRLQCLLNLVKQSSFVFPSMVPYFQCCVSCHGEGRYGMSVALLLPLLEHSLRTIFARVNDCPDRVLTAESSTLYTTFDEILGQFLPDGNENQIRRYLGDGFMDFLHDLLMYQEGPRIRDRISHGQCDFIKISKTVSTVLLSLMAGLCIQSLPKRALSSSQFSAWVETHDILASYKSQFHPLARLKQQIIKVSQNLFELTGVQRPEISNSTVQGTSECKTNIQKAAMTCCEYVGEAMPKLKELYRFIDTDSGRLIGDLLCDRLDTLYTCQRKCQQGSSKGDRSISELELVVILRQILAQCCEIVAQTLSFGNETFLQWKEKTLRSRQRNNYQRYLESLTCLSGGVRLMVVVAVCEMKTSNQCIHSLSKQRFLKQVLQISENITTYSV